MLIDLVIDEWEGGSIIFKLSLENLLDFIEGVD